MTLPDEFLEIDTPENVVFGYEVAGVGSRFIAALIDTSILIGLEAIVLFTALALVVNGQRQYVQTTGDESGAWTIAIFGLLAFAIFWGYYIFFELVWNGQSPGKRVAKLRVIRANGMSVTLVEALVRNLVRFVDFLPGFYGIGLVTMFIDGQARRLGDMAAGTLVVHTRAEVTLESLIAKPSTGTFNAPRDILEDLAPDDAALPVERLSSQDFSMIEDYFRRRLELSGRESLAMTIAKSISARLGITPPASFREAEQFLSKVLRKRTLSER